ncbi:MAG TPA: hypothetical protein VFH48_33505 [Chloroflexota bacterium]|nr:hypothetical protein [Chloroflexota bacterium]
MVSATVLLTLSLAVVALRWRAARPGDLLNAWAGDAPSRRLAAS